METSRLAQKLALEMIDQLPSPQWGLINSLDSTALYEAMDKHFGTHDTNSPPDQEPGGMSLPGNYGDDSQKTQAQIYYLLGLISNSRTKDAVVVAKKWGARARSTCRGRFQGDGPGGYTAALDNFFYEVLSQDPGLPFWDEYVLLAARTGKTDRMLNLARAAAANDDLSSGRKTAIHENLAKALLAADDLDEGVAEIRALLAATNSPASPNDFNAGEGGTGNLGIALARIGMLTDKPEWTAEGIKAAQTWLADEHQSQDTWVSPMVAESLAATLSDLKRGPEAEAVLTDALTRVVRANAAQQNNAWNNDNTAAQLLTELAMLYDHSQPLQRRARPARSGALVGRERRE